ncbi:hypothetical protein [Methanolobus sp. WCC5]|jgi:hypothetical protein|uniref:hypothetical protein n=1 Tax=Methanolobus sp. WCC5 TaxID=3125785 RepID=UPI003249A0D9
MSECELLIKCGFFKKYQSTKELACKGFISRYCKGTDMDNCKRKAYRKEHGVAPSDDMMPDGHMIGRVC